MSFGSRLKQRRKDLGLKQSELGKLLGVTGSAIGNYENDFSSPKADILYKAFDILHCDANFLFQDEMKKAPASEGAGDKDIFTESLQSSEDSILLSDFHKLNRKGREAAQAAIKGFTFVPEYTDSQAEDAG